jgi:hypothetical protein
MRPLLLVIHPLSFKKLTHELIGISHNKYMIQHIGKNIRFIGSALSDRENPGSKYRLKCQNAPGINSASPCSIKISYPLAYFRAGNFHNPDFHNPHHKWYEPITELYIKREIVPDQTTEFSSSLQNGYA